MYVVAFEMNGLALAHPNQKLIGKMTADGKAIFRAYVETGNAKGKGWVDYKWPNPTSSAVENKTTFVEKVDEAIIGCGVYKD